MASPATILTAVTVRISAADLKNLTRHEPTTSDSYDSTVLTAAVTDAIAEAEEAVGVTLDDTNALHVALLIRGCLLKLQDYKRIDFDKATAYDQWLNELRTNKRQTIGANKRFRPRTSVGRQPRTPAYREHLEISSIEEGLVPGGSSWKPRQSDS